jgi:predicted GNAT family acetyltransferase
MFTAHFHEDVRAFRERTRHFLLHNPVFNMHQLRMASRAVEQFSEGLESDVLWGIDVEHRGETVCSAMFTRRGALFVSPHPTEATDALLSAIPAIVKIYDVVGQSDAAWSVARALGNYELFIEGSLYALQTAPSIVPSPVRCIQANASHLQTIVDWNVAFINELKLKDPVTDIAKHAMYRVERSQYFLALNGTVPVGMAGGTYAGDGVASIGPVYVLPEYRQRGLKIGQAVTAFTAQQVRAKGATCVVLMADQKNPVSNAAYQKIGFENRGQFHHLQQIGQPTR